MDNQTAEELVIYGTEDLLAKMMQAMMITPKAHSDLRAFAKEAGIDLPGHGL
jgi:acetylglutamate kinase